MSAWLKREDKKSPEWGGDAFSDVLIDSERTWPMYMLCHATEWAHLPDPGGWNDQEEVFLHDAGVYSRRVSYLRAIKRTNEDRRKEAKAQLSKGRKFFRRRK